MDRSWMYNLNRLTNKFSEQVDAFIEVAVANEMKINQHKDILCPCKDCRNSRRHITLIVKDHLVRRGFVQDYSTWIWHGEKKDYGRSTSCVDSDTDEGVEYDNQDDESEEEDRIDDMMHDVEEHLNEQPNIFDNISRASKTELYPGCSKYTTLSAILKFFNLKTRHNMTDECFTDWLQLLAEMFPDGNSLPTSTYRAKKLMCPMGIEYEKIHACPKDCVLYRNEYADLDKCPRCASSRYKNDGPAKNKKNIPAKILWYLPIIPRFKRLFADENTGKLLRWHDEVRKRDGLYRHPADGPQWRNIDREFPEFGTDPRNLRLGLCTDGMNPYGTLSTTYNTWPVLLTIYNLPPWLCMKRKYIMLSLLISGPKQPGNDIDVYLAPLIDDLKLLWEVGVQTFDAYSKTNFTLRAMIFCTINDFPAYGNLSGYPIKGKKACPICEDDTQSIRLQHCNKHVYMNHRRFLPRNHSFRRKRKSFNGHEERNSKPNPSDSMDVYNRVKDIQYEYGKPYKANVDGGYKKRSIFWDLPYWRYLEIRHCLDVMHIEKNVCDAIIGTLLNIPGKTKDGYKARQDMADMGRKELAPEQKGTRIYLPPAHYTLSRAEKTSLCTSLKELKVPTGYCSNFNRIVSTTELKLIGMKSHDNHVLMQQFLPVAIRGILPEHVRYTITRLCLFFHTISSKVIDPLRLSELQTDVVQTLCGLEIYFPPSFFDIMPHLVVHLVREVQWCGPVFLRYMYPFERVMGILKGMVMNLARPEASIVQRTVAEEVATWCTEYLARTQEIGVPKSRHYDRLQGKGTTTGISISIEHSLLCKAELYVLHHLSDVRPYWMEHMEVLKQENPSKSDVELMQMQEISFRSWFRSRVMSELSTNPNMTPTLRWLAYGCTQTVQSYEGYDINGYTFYTTRHDANSVQQNSGVSVVAFSSEYASKRDKTLVEKRKIYYGVIENIFELTYSTQFTIPLFQCRWVDSDRGVKKDEHDFLTCVNFNQVGHQQDPFIMASQAKQVFYVDDPKDNNFRIALEGKRRILGIDDIVDEQEYDDQLIEMPSSKFDLPIVDILNDDNTNFVRQDHNEGYFVVEK